MPTLSLDPHRCAGCGGWSMGWCGTCQRIAHKDAVQTLLAQAEGRAHRGALEDALPGTGYQHRPTTARPQPHRGAGARNTPTEPRHTPNT